MNISGVFRHLIVTASAVAAFVIRLFSVIRFEPMIHEYDPWFNYRATEKLVNEGLGALLSWTDTAWYPYGRNYRTMYPGVVVTSGALHYILNNILGIRVSIRTVCIGLGALSSSAATFVAYHFGKRLGSRLTGVFASILIAIVPGFLSRTVAGSYDNEAIAIFLVITSFFFWVRAVQKGTIKDGALTAVFYIWLSLSWGGCIFVISAISLHIILLFVLKKLTFPIMRAYLGFYALSILASTITTGTRPFRSIELALPHVAMGAIVLLLSFNTIRKGYYERRGEKAPPIASLFRVCVIIFGLLLACALFLASSTGKIEGWTGRLYSFIDPTYAKKHTPIVASISEHQPSSASSFFFDMHLVIMLVPAGLVLCVCEATAARLFMVIVTLCGLWFSEVMVRLMLIMAPVGALTAAIPLADLFEAVSGIIMDRLKKLLGEIYEEEKDEVVEKQNREELPFTEFDSLGKRLPSRIFSPKLFTPVILAICTYTSLIIMLAIYVTHCHWVAKNAYSSPTVVMRYTTKKGKSGHIDDFRQAYQWLNQNTSPDAKVAAWWDYGYQIHGMADRTVIVDNNTKNFHHIARVGRMFAMQERQAWDIITKDLDADYVMVVYGGALAFVADDINKFIWMARITEMIYDDVHESDYKGDWGYSIGKHITKMMSVSLMYKLSVHRFDSLDRTRQTQPGVPVVRLSHFEEVFTSENWLVRIYRPSNPNPFDSRPVSGKD